MPKVSVIIPVYNVELYLEECLNSVINQTYKNLEIICIDDHSTDGSLEILRAYSCKDSRIVLLRNNGNHGLAYTRNRGIDRASGDYILFVDSDDYIRVDLLEVILEHAPYNDLVCFDYIARNEIEHKDIVHTYALADGLYKDTSFLIEATINKSVIYSACTKLYNRNFLAHNKIRFYDGILYEDVVFTFRCFLSARRIYNTKERLYFYRVRKQSIMTGGFTFRHIESYFINLCELCRLYLEHDFDARTAEAIEEYIRNVGRAFVKAYKACEEHHVSESMLIRDNTCYLKLYNIVSGLCDTSPKRRELEEAKAQHWRAYEKVIVYGAGEVARAVIELLDQCDIPVYGIAVTSSVNNRKSLLGNMVREITWYTDVKEDCLVIIAAGPPYSEDIRRELELLQFRHYIEAV